MKRKRHLQPLQGHQPHTPQSALRAHQIVELGRQLGYSTADLLAAIDSQIPFAELKPALKSFSARYQRDRLQADLGGEKDAPILVLR